MVTRKKPLALITALLLTQGSACNNTDFTSNAPESGRPHRGNRTDPRQQPSQPSTGLASGIKSEDLATSVSTNTSTSDVDMATSDPGANNDIDWAAEQQRLSELLVEDGGTLSIPGIRVQRVGVNFEDSPDGVFRDFNDAVLCFTGAFKVDGTTIISYQNQTVHAELSNSSACTHRIDITIIDPDGGQRVIPPQEHTSYQQTIGLDLDFRIQSRLSVSFSKVGVAVPQYGDGCVDGIPGQPIRQDNPTWSQVGLDVCNAK